MTNKTKSIIGGVTVLGLSGIICKLVGVLFAIPLQWMIGLEGLGVYNAVFPTYNLLLTISSAGLPVAVSRLVARSIARDDPRGAKQVFQTALLLLAAVGSLATIFILAGSSMLSNWVGMPESLISFRVIAPCVVLVCVLSAFRGFMQGQQNMTPTAISQLIEQVGKVFLALPLAWLGSTMGADAQQSAAYGAAGALLGTTLAEAAALVYMIILAYGRRSSFASLPQIADASIESRRDVTRQLMSISIPITIGACIVPLSQFIDSAMLMDRLQLSGATYEAAQRIYGLFSGTVIRLINIPTALALAVSMSLVPAISAAKELEDYDAVRKQSDLGLRFAFLIGFPCSIGMSLLAEPMMRFFYGETTAEEYLVLGGELLAVSSLTIVLFTVVQATSSILQGLGKQRIPMYTLIAGVVMKVVLNYVLVGMPGVGIHGAPIASLVCYMVSLVPNLIYVLRYGKVRMNWMGWLAKPGLASLIMGAAVFAAGQVLPAGRITTLLLVAVGVAVYVAAALALGAVTKEDLRSFRRRR